MLSPPVKQKPRDQELNRSTDHNEVNTKFAGTVIHKLNDNYHLFLSTEGKKVGQYT